jgi:hypothetical protein
VIEQRRHARYPIDCPLFFSVKGTAETRAEPREGLAKDVAIGGMFVETAEPAAFGDEVIVRVLLPGAAEEVSLPGRVRWVGPGGMGVQFGLLGAAETHVINEIGRASKA